MAERLQPVVPPGTKKRRPRAEGPAGGCGLARRVPLRSLSPQARGGSSARQAEGAPASASKADCRSPVVTTRVAAPCVPSPFGSARRVPVTQAELSREQLPSSRTPGAQRPPAAASKTPLAERSSPLPGSPPRGTVGVCGLARRVPLRPRSPQLPWPQGTSPAPSTRQAEGGPASATKAGFKSPVVAARVAAPCVPSPFGSARRVPVTQLSREQPPFFRTPRAQRPPVGARRVRDPHLISGGAPEERDKEDNVPVLPATGGAQLGCSPPMAAGLGTVLEQLPPSPPEPLVSPMELPPSPPEEPLLGALQEPVTSLDTGHLPGSTPPNPTGGPCSHRPPWWLETPGHLGPGAASGAPVGP